LFPSLRKPIDFSPGGCKFSAELRHLGERDLSLRLFGNKLDLSGLQACDLIAKLVFDRSRRVPHDGIGAPSCGG